MVEVDEAKGGTVVGRLVAGGLVGGGLVAGGLVAGGLVAGGLVAGGMVPGGLVTAVELEPGLVIMLDAVVDSVWVPISGVWVGATADD